MKKILLICVLLALTGCGNTDKTISNEVDKALATLNAPEDLIIDENFDVNTILTDVQEGTEVTYEVDEENSKIVITLKNEDRIETLEAPIMAASVEEKPTEEEPTEEVPTETPVETPVENNTSDIQYPVHCVGTVNESGVAIPDTYFDFLSETEFITGNSESGYNYSGSFDPNTGEYRDPSGMLSTITSISPTEFYEDTDGYTLGGTRYGATYVCEGPHPLH